MDYKVEGNCRQLVELKLQHGCFAVTHTVPIRGNYRGLDVLRAAAHALSDKLPNSTAILENIRGDTLEIECETFEDLEKMIVEAKIVSIERAEVIHADARGASGHEGGGPERK